MSLLGILFGIAMVFLIAKAIIETIWGLILVIYGLACYALGVAIGLFAEFLSVLWKLKRAARW